MSFRHFREQLGQIALAADAEVRAQTPPRGGPGEWYHCPACPQQRQTRGDMRSHLIMCERYRDLVLGTVDRSLLPKQVPQLS